MRVHIQNEEDDQIAITHADWDAALARAGEDPARYTVSIGDTPVSLADGLRDAEVLIAAKAALFGGLPVPAPRLGVIFATSAGLEGLAPYDWLPDGCALLNNRGTHADKGGEFALMATLMLINRVPQFVTDQRAGVWNKRWGTVAAGRRITIVGLGTLGEAAAQRIHPLGMRIAGVRANPAPHPLCDVVVGLDGLDALLPTTDVLLLACPLTPATRGLLDARRIGLLGPEAGVINIGRGPLIEEAALCDALDAGRLRGAVLDVFDPEPPALGSRIWTTRDLIVSPHTSADDPETYNANSLDIFLANLADRRAGRPMANRFDVERGY
jgi:phosphoglycerate dehydrogenase-like enzyme